MANTIYDRTIAFAGICQAVALVQKVAKDGYCDSDAFETSLRAILATNPSNTIGVFGSEADLKVGLECLVNGIDSTPTGSAITRYIISLLALERKLTSRRDAMSQLGDRIQMIERQVEHFDLLDEQMISNLASVYLDVISPYRPSHSSCRYSSGITANRKPTKGARTTVIRYSLCSTLASSRRPTSSSGLRTQEDG